MSYLCITSWRLNKGYSTPDEQPPGDSILRVQNIVYSAMVIRLTLRSREWL